MLAQNKIFLTEEVAGKGRFFRARFLQPGLVKYSFGVCLLTKEVIDSFVQGFVGCSVTIDHVEIDEDNCDDVCCGVISRVEYNEEDGWYWCEGILRDPNAIELVRNGYTVSCQYEITEYADNTENALHNGIEYDKVILGGKCEHLAIVKNPRYEGAMIAVNAQEFRTADDGHVYPIKEDKRGVEYLNDIARRIKVPLNFSAVLGKKGCFEARLTPEGRRRWGDFIEKSFQGGLIDKRGWDKDSDGDVFKVRFKSKEDNMAQNASDKDGKWITIKGTHVFIKDGQSVEDAMKETSGSSSTGKRKQDGDKGAAEAKSKDLEGKYSREDAEFDIEQAQKDIEEARSLGYEKIEDIAEFLGLDEDEVREMIGGKSGGQNNDINSLIERFDLNFKDELSEEQQNYLAAIIDATKRQDVKELNSLIERFDLNFSDELSKEQSDYWKHIVETSKGASDGQKSNDKKQSLKDNLRGKYEREDADFDVVQAKKDIAEAKKMGYKRVEDIAEFLGLDEDEVREFLNPSAKNSVEEQFKECLYDLAAETIVEKLKDSHYLKM